MLGEYLKHQICLKNVIDYVMETDKMGSDFYHHYSDEFSGNKSIHDMFLELAEEDEVHLKKYKEMLLKKLSSTNARISEYKFQQIRKYTPEYFCVYDEDGKLSADAAMNGILRYEEKIKGAFSELNEQLEHLPELDRVIELENTHISKLKNFISSLHSSYMMRLGNI